MHYLAITRYSFLVMLCPIILFLTNPQLYIYSFHVGNCIHTRNATLHIVTLYITAQQITCSSYRTISCHFIWLLMHYFMSPLQSHYSYFAVCDFWTLAFPPVQIRQSMQDLASYPILLVDNNLHVHIPSRTDSYKLQQSMHISPQL